MQKSHHLSRNEFVKITVGAMGAVIAGVVGIPAVAFLLSPALKDQVLDAWVSLGPLDIYPVGEPTLFTFTRSRVNGWEKTVYSYGVYVYRKNEAEVMVFSNVCTHLACRVAFKEDTREYDCPCHDAQFDIEGNIIAGPQPRPMDRYEAKVEEGLLSIRLLEG